MQKGRKREMAVNHNSLSALKSKLKVIESSREPWKKQIQELESAKADLEKCISINEKQIYMKSDEIKHAVDKVSSSEEQLKQLKVKQQTVLKRMDRIVQLSAQPKNMKRKNVKKIMEQLLEKKKGMIRHINSNIRSLEGNLQMFNNELKAINKLPPSERAKIVSDKELSDLKKRVEDITKKIKGQQLVLKIHEEELKQINDDMSKLLKSRKSQEELKKQRTEVEIETTSLSQDIARVERQRADSGRVARKGSIQLAKLKAGGTQYSGRLSQLEEWRTEASNRLKIIDAAHKALEERIKRIEKYLQKESEVSQPEIEDKRPMVLGYPCEMEVGLISDGKIQNGKLTVTAFLFIFEAKNGKTRSKSPKDFCVDVSDIDTITWPTESKAIIQVKLRKNYTNRMNPQKPRKEEVRNLELEFKGLTKTENFRELFQLLNLAILLHKSTTAALPEGYSIFPKSRRNSRVSLESSQELSSSQIERIHTASSSTTAPQPPRTSLQDSLALIDAKQREIVNEMDIAFEGKSLIVSEDTLKSIISYAPERLHIEDWKLQYSLEDGASLSKFYAKLRDVHDTILLVQDSRRSVFGVFANSEYYVDDHHHGNGETFVFKVASTKADESKGDKALKELRQVEPYMWTGKNELIMLCNKDALAFGGGVRGGYALRMDANLDEGSTEECMTFDSPPLTNSRDFQIYKVEVWAPAPLV
mmetsp:Transcript_3163/g.4748  ORF Transcript_3163/g.4748 Transcript_3163/m.4748 type:complete len:702 (+) Transcript_3163:76-2181(+)